jgi:hypothetical protein
MSDLTDWLLAQIAADEAVARAAAEESAPEWEHAYHLGSGQIQTANKVGQPGYQYHQSVTHDYEGLSDSVDPAAGVHIATHDPARILAECAAKRAIVGLDICTACQVEMQPCHHRDDTLRALASVYADREGYDEGWAP